MGAAAKGLYAVRSDRRTRTLDQCLEDWREEAREAAILSCRAYGVSFVWVPILQDCVLGILAVESKFGRSPRYRAKSVLQHVLGNAQLTRRFAPRSLGIAQINQQRADYLAGDAGLDHELDVRSTRGAIEGTALGLAKAVSLYTAGRMPKPTRPEPAILVITHNAGWLAPRVARLQMALAKLDLLPQQAGLNGIVGPTTLSALDRVAVSFGCRSLADELHSNGSNVPPAWGLTHPDIFPLVRRGDLFRLLQNAAAGVGEDLDEPLFPNYEIRRWYTGRITAAGYARTVLAYADS